MNNIGSLQSKMDTIETEKSKNLEHIEDDMSSVGGESFESVSINPESSRPETPFKLPFDSTCFACCDGVSDLAAHMAQGGCLSFPSGKN